MILMACASCRTSKQGSTTIATDAETHVDRVQNKMHFETLESLFASVTSFSADSIVIELPSGLSPDTTLLPDIRARPNALATVRLYAPKSQSAKSGWQRKGENSLSSDSINEHGRATTNATATEDVRKDLMRLDDWAVCVIAISVVIAISLLIYAILRRFTSGIV